MLVPIDAFDLAKLPAHLRVTFAVEAADGTEVARGKDLEALQEQLAAPVREAVAEAVAGELERTGLRAWPDDLDELPRIVETHRRRAHGARLPGAGRRGRRGRRAGVRHRGRAGAPRWGRAPAGCCGCRCRRRSRPLRSSWIPRTRLVLGTNPDGSLAALLDDCADAAVAALAPEPVWSRAEFAALRDRVAAALVADDARHRRPGRKVLAAAHEVQLALPAKPPPAQAEPIADIRAQLGRLLPTGFVAATGAAHLVDLARYLTAIGRRLERLPHGVGADRERMERVHAVQDAYDELVAALSPARAAADDVRDIARLIEELRVSLWAQQLGTARPVSEQRIYRAIDAITQS